MRNARKAIGSASHRDGQTLGQTGRPRRKPLLKDSKAMSGFAESVAKPVAEKMAANSTGRSVLETVNKISGDALGAAPKKPDNPLNAFVTKLAGGRGRRLWPLDQNRI